MPHELVQRQISCSYISNFLFRIFVPDLKANTTEAAHQPPIGKPEGISQLILSRGKVPVNLEETKPSQKQRQG